MLIKTCMHNRTVLTQHSLHIILSFDKKVICTRNGNILYIRIYTYMSGIKLHVTAYN